MTGSLNFEIIIISRILVDVMMALYRLIVCHKIQIDFCFTMKDIIIIKILYFRHCYGSTLFSPSILVNTPDYFSTDQDQKGLLYHLDLNSFWIDSFSFSTYRRFIQTVHIMYFDFQKYDIDSFYQFLKC